MAVKLGFLVAFTLVCFGLRVTDAVLQPEFPAFETESKIRLNSNRGYVNVLIAIGETVREDVTFIDRIKEVFSEFSKVLYDVTNEYGSGVHLEEVNILIPDSWSDDERYESSSGESFAASDIRIDRSNNEGSRNRNQPYTHKATACGIPGLYIRLTPDYINDDATASFYGDRSKTLLHEWAHFRWGVFDEYPLPGDDHFYAASNGQFEATKCVAAIQGKKFTNEGDDCTFSIDGSPGQDCRFFDDTGISETYEASLMYKQFLPEMRKFCDGPEITFWVPSVTHNAEAPNQQNIHCASRSIWEVLRQHSDFPDTVIRSPIPENALPQVNVQPSFRLLKRRVPRSPIMLVLDTSSSMNAFQRLHILRQASFNLITRVLIDEQIFGIVSFEATAQTLLSPTKVGSNREGITSSLPTEGNGYTSIGSGVLEAVDNLRRLVPNYQDQGTQMIVLTDGIENRFPKITSLQDSKLTGITIHTIAIGQQADDKLELLANRTNGRTFEQRNESAALFNIFTRLAVQNDADIIEILSETFNLTGITRRFYVDSTSVGQLTVLVGFPENTLQAFAVRIIKPNGDHIDSLSLSPDTYSSFPDFDLIQIDSEVIVGEWQILVTNNGSGPTNVLGTMHVETRRLSIQQVLPIVIDADWALTTVEPSEIQTLQVTVSQGYTPVCNAVVKATVSTPEGDPVALPVFDDGVGADIRPGDGIYSGFFTKFNGTGRYSVQVSVNGIDGVTKLMKGSFVGQGPAAADPTLLPEVTVDPVNTGSFERSTEGESFKCRGEMECNGTLDMYAPYRISDLTGYTVLKNATAVLTFTAPGDDLFDGEVSYYEIHIATNVTRLLRDFNATEILQYIPTNQTTNETQAPYITSGNPSNPLPARNMETFYVKLPDEGGKFNYIFSVVAVDDFGLKSQASNFATVTADMELMQRNSKVTIVLGTLLPVLFIILLSFILLLLFVKRRRSTKSHEEDKYKGTSESESISQAIKVGDFGDVQNGTTNTYIYHKENNQLMMPIPLPVPRPLTQRNLAHLSGQGQFTSSEKRQSDLVVNLPQQSSDAMKSAYNFVGAASQVDTSKSYAYNFMEPTVPAPELIRTATTCDQSREILNPPPKRSSPFGIDNPIFEGDNKQVTKPVVPKRPYPRSFAGRDDDVKSDNDDADDYEFVADPKKKSGQVTDTIQNRFPKVGKHLLSVEEDPGEIPYSYDEPPKSGNTNYDSDNDSDDYEPVIDPNTNLPFGLA